MKTTRKQFSVPWGRLCAAHPRDAISEATLTLYYEKFCKFDIETIGAAVEGCIDRHDFFPTIPQFKKAIAELPAPLHKLLDEPRPSAEKVAENRKTLKDLIDKSAKTMEARKVNEEERRAFLKKQARIINAAEKEHKA